MKPEEKNSLKQELLHSIFSYRQQQINNYQQKYTKQDIMVCLSHLKSKKPEDQSFFDQTISAAKQLTLPSIEKYFVRQLQSRMITVDNFSVQYELIAKELAQNAHYRVVKRKNRKKVKVLFSRYEKVFHI